MNRIEHLLQILSEECNEVGQRASKANRFGLDEVEPGQSLANAERIRKEFADLCGVYEMIGLNPPSREDIEAKKQKVEKFLTYSAELGTFDIVNWRELGPNELPEEGDEGLFNGEWVSVLCVSAWLVGGKRIAGSRFRTKRHAKTTKENPRDILSREELVKHLDGLTITSENIGDIRRSLFTRNEGEWNALVRKLAAEMEKGGQSISDPVKYPKHYTSHPSGVECIAVTEHMNFCLGNAMKYIWRAGEKGDAVEDLKKARWYIDREIERMEKQK